MQPQLAAPAVTLPTVPVLTVASTCKCIGQDSRSGQLGGAAAALLLLPRRFNAWQLTASCNSIATAPVAPVAAAAAHGLLHSPLQRVMHLNCS
jgi:hypothetical protein